VILNFVFSVHVAVTKCLTKIIIYYIIKLVEWNMSYLDSLREDEESNE